MSILEPPASPPPRSVDGIAPAAIATGPRLPTREVAFEHAMSLVLASGVLLSAVVVLVGGALYLARNPSLDPDYRVFVGEPGDLRTVTGIIGQSAALKGEGIIQLGLLLLVLTPVARVAMSVVVFGRERDLAFTAVTLTVLTLLLVGLIGQGF